MGLVLLLGGREILAFTATEAVIPASGDNRLTYWRKTSDPLSPVERCMIWDLVTPASSCEADLERGR